VPGTTLRYLPTNPKDPHYADRHILASIKKIALTLSFIRGHRNGNVPRIDKMGSMLIAYIYVAVVLEHPKLMPTESKQMISTGKPRF
jgi:hypothetical protein